MEYDSPFAKSLFIYCRLLFLKFQISFIFENIATMNISVNRCIRFEILIFLTKSLRMRNILQDCGNSSKCLRQSHIIRAL